VISETGVVVPLMALSALMTLMGWVEGVLGRSVGVGLCGFGGTRWGCWWEGYQCDRVNQCDQWYGGCLYH
jgi:hypothetical protein